MSMSDAQHSMVAEPSPSTFWRGLVGTLAALTERALRAGDRAGAEDLVRAIFAVCDLASAGASAGSRARGRAARRAPRRAAPRIPERLRETGKGEVGAGV